MPSWTGRLIQSLPSLLGEMDPSSFGQAGTGFTAVGVNQTLDTGAGGGCASSSCRLNDEQPDRNGVMRFGFVCFAGGGGGDGGGCAEAPQPPGDGRGGVRDQYLCLDWPSISDVPVPPVIG